MQKRSTLAILVVRVAVPLSVLLACGFVAERAGARGRGQPGASPRAEAAPGPKRTAYHATVEVTRKARGVPPRTLSAALNLVSGERPARVRLTGGGARCKLGLALRPYPDGAAVVQLDLQWSEVSAPGKAGRRRPARRAEASLTSRVSPGKRVELGTFRQSDGAQITIHLTLK